MRTSRRNWADVVGNIIVVLGLSCCALIVLWALAIGIAWVL